MPSGRAHVDVSFKLGCGLAGSPGWFADVGIICNSGDVVVEALEELEDPSVVVVDDPSVVVEDPSVVVEDPSVVVEDPVKVSTGPVGLLLFDPVVVMLFDLLSLLLDPVKALVLLAEALVLKPVVVLFKVVEALLELEFLEPTTPPTTAAMITARIIAPMMIQPTGRRYQGRFAGASNAVGPAAGRSSTERFSGLPNDPPSDPPAPGATGAGIREDVAARGSSSRPLV